MAVTRQGLTGSLESKSAGGRVDMLVSPHPGEGRQGSDPRKQFVNMPAVLIE